MSSIRFSKYHGTGNDFVIVDNRNRVFDSDNNDLVMHICHRRFGVGADGFLLLESSDKGAFAMRYYNSDGRESTMCGNGGRCLVAFARQLGLVKDGELVEFEAIDGLHHAVCMGDIISLKMVDVKGIEELDGGFYLDTGSPHFVRYVDDLQGTDVYKEGSKLRYSNMFGDGGANINFVRYNKAGHISLRTYERGVEDETWSCGTGTVASVLTSYYRFGGPLIWDADVKGGKLKVSFTPAGRGSFTDIRLDGPAKFVFEGTLDNFLKQQDGI